MAAGRFCVILASTGDLAGRWCTVPQAAGSRGGCLPKLAAARPTTRSQHTPQVKSNLHVAFTTSPVGEAFRVRSQRFLATINSTVIDWCAAGWG